MTRLKRQVTADRVPPGGLSCPGPACGLPDGASLRTVGHMATLTLHDTDIDELTAVLRRLAPTIARIETACTPARFGRPRDWTVTGMLAVFLAAARHHDTFHVDRAATLADTLSLEHRRRLGAHRSNGAPYTHRQVSYAWNTICRALDPATVGDTTLKAARLDDLQRVSAELLWGTVPRHIRRAWAGDIAIDATIVDTHSRPRPADQDYDRNTHPYLAALTNPAPMTARARNGRTRRWDRGRRPTGADWTGHHNRYGYAHHVAVLAPPATRSIDLPAVAVALATTPASAHPARSAIPLLDHTYAVTGTPLHDVLADAGYSQAAPADWTLAVRARGAEPVFRLHATNQEGHRATLNRRSAGTTVGIPAALIVDGHPYCPCLPDHLHHMTRPTGVDDHRGRARWRRDSRGRDTYAYRLRSTNRDIGLRFSAPHINGCRHCADSRYPCCATKTICVPWTQLGHYQRDRFGTTAWEHSFNRRNRVEGFFGIIKSNAGGAALTGVGMRFWEYAKVTLATTLCAMATNLHLIAQWQQRQTADAPSSRGRPREHGTLAELVERAAPPTKRERLRRRQRARARPNPFAHLGDPRDDG